MSTRILVTPAAIKAQNPCAERWAAYRRRFKGDTPHALAGLLGPVGASDGARYDQKADFLWILRRLPDNPVLRTLGRRLWASWRASGDRYFLQATQWSGSDHRDYIFPGDLPDDWKERALAVIATMERERNEARGSRA